jgi:stress-induced morphogen
MPGAQAVRVLDTSGGCGSMYRIEIAADEFRGQSIVKQHQLVTKALEDEIPKWHGFVLDTKVS